MTNFEKAKAWIEDKWIENEKRCEVCGNKNWGVDHKITSIPRAMFDKEAFPVFFCACKECGNTKMFSATISGLIEK